MKLSAETDLDMKPHWSWPNAHIAPYIYGQISRLGSILWNEGVIVCIIYQKYISITLIIMLRVRRSSTLDSPFGGPDAQKLSFLSAPSAPLQSPQIKKITHPLRDRLRRGSHMPPSLPRLRTAFLSTNAVPALRATCSPMTAPPRRACRARAHHPIAAVTSTTGIACALSPRAA
jgi:hypothetical protein